MSLRLQLCVCGRTYLFILSCFFFFYNLHVSSLVRLWEMSQAHTSSLFSPSFFFTLHTVVFLMRLVTDQLSAGVQHNYVSFHISTYLRIRKHYGDETKQTVTIPSLPELILSEEKSYSSSTLHLNMRVWEMRVCVCSGWMGVSIIMFVKVFSCLMFCRCVRAINSSALSVLKYVK